MPMSDSPRVPCLERWAVLFAQAFGLCIQGGWRIRGPLILPTSSHPERGGLLQSSLCPTPFTPFPCPVDPLNSPVFSSVQFKNILLEQPLSVRNCAGGAHSQGKACVLPSTGPAVPSPSSQSAQTSLTCFVLLTGKSHFVWPWSLVSGRSMCSHLYFLNERM